MTLVDKYVHRHRKALMSALIAGLTALIAALADGHLTLPKILGIILATLTSGGAVYVTPNKGTNGPSD